MRRWFVAAALTIMLTGCASDGLLGQAFQPDVYVVRPGDTIYSIAWRYSIDPQDLIAWNGIDDPRNLQPGRHLVLHASNGGASESRPSPVSRTPTEAAGGRARAASADAGGAAGVASGHESHTARGGPKQWRWPTRGRVVGTFHNGRVAGRGLDISGDYDQPVDATAGGKVVYSGKGLKAYGRLIIIRHDHEYLSAYAHNSKLLVHEGDRVTGGQKIARMGRANDGEPVLHFEIRRNGKPVDPLDYLPSRDSGSQ